MAHTTTPFQALGAKSPPLWKTYVAFLVPMVISNILQAVSGTVNNIYLGQMLGVQALAAGTASFPLLFMLISFMIGLGMGASVLIGQAWGAKEPERLREIAATTLTVGVLAGLVVAVLGGIWTEEVLRALGTPPDIMADAVANARVAMLTAPVLFVFLLITSMQRGVGDTKTPLKTLVISTAVGLVLTPAFIKGWLGLPQLGVASAATASGIGLVVALAWTARYMRHNRHPMAPDAAFRKHLGINKPILAKVVRIGLPTAVTVLTMALSELSVLFLVNRFGSHATAAYGAVNQIISYVQFPALSISISASILGAQAIGAGRTRMLGQIAKTGILLNLVFTGALVAAGYALSRPILGLFIADGTVVDTAQSLLHIMLWSIVIMGMSTVLSGLMRASGTVVVPTGLTVLAIGGVQLPVAWLLSQRYGLNGVWAAYPVAFVAMLCMQTAYYRLVWRKKPIRRL